MCREDGIILERTGGNKMTKIRRISACLLSAAIAVSSLVPAGSAQAASAAKVKRVEFTKPVTSTLAFKKGESFRLKTSVSPKKAAKSIAFSSSKKSVVRVTNKGVLKAKKAGKAKITAASTTKPKKKATVQVTVYKSFTKVKAVSLNKTAAALKPGESLALEAAVSPKQATVKKVTYETSDKAVASVSKTGVITAKKAGKANITVYAQDGRGAKAVCHITVGTEGASGPSASAAPSTSATAAPSATVQPGATEPAATEPGATERPPESRFVIASANEAAPVYIDENGSDYDGLSLVAESFAGDVSQVLNSGASSPIVTKAEQLKQSAIIVGSIGNNAVIDSLISQGKLDVSGIQGKWETYKIQFVEAPTPGVDKAIVVVGSDKRGAIYGLYHISEKMGVSPWIYWGDAVPDKKDEIVLSNWDLEMTSKEPSVKFRGIFLNDEAPSLTGWVQEKFGDYNEDFYAHVFELILRCKGNYLWPAMWGNEFSKDGKEFALANAELADKYGIVMGTSHHEPLCRAGNEWGQEYKDYGAKRKTWDFTVNEAAITKFWEAGVERNKSFENVYTLGMRGEADSALAGGVKENIDLLKNVITVQKRILADNNVSQEPQVLTVYKEVETYWHGAEGVEGLKNWDVLDDVIIMLCDDNNGNLRTLPTTKAEQERAGGWGMYYHFDYHGGPTSYEWVNTKELNKAWEQMTMAYEHGIDDIWIVNVGDLKPMEMNISYFLDMAYDYDTWGENGRNKTDEYMKRWVRQQFGASLSEEQAADIVSLLKDYTWLNTCCTPEALKNNTYHVTNYNEAQEMVKKTRQMMQKADECQKFIPQQLQAAYYQLVYYPTVASANVAQIMLYSGLNQYYFELGSASTNVYGELLQKAIEYDKTLEYTYNNEMPGVGDKWKNMMSSPHVGFVTWDSNGWKYPDVQDIQFPTDDSNKLLVTLQNQHDAYTEGECELDAFTNLNQESDTVTVSNGGGFPYDYTAQASADWIQLSKTSGHVSDQDTFEISVDWDKVTANTSGMVTVTGAGSTVTIKVAAEVYDVSGLDSHTYVYANGYASMLAGGYVSSGEGADGTYCAAIDNYGKMGQSVKAFPSNFCFANQVTAAPYVEYKVNVPKSGTYKFSVYTAPSNNVDRQDVGIRYGLSVNGGSAQLVNTIRSDYQSGEYSGTWAGDVSASGRKTVSDIELQAGTNTIRVYAVDPTLVLQKLVVSEEDVLTSHFGPRESYFVK